MANEEVSNIGVKLSLDASNFNAGMSSAQGKLNTLQKQAATAASGAKAGQAATGTAAGGKTTASAAVGVTITPAELQRALTVATRGIQSVHVPIDVDAKSLSSMKSKITSAIGVVPVTIAPQFAKSGPTSPQAIIGTVFSAMGGLSPQKGQVLAQQAINQILPKRAMGGPVESGRPVIVGERRPEVFRPGASGFIEKDVAQYRRHAAELAALQYQIQQREKSIQHARGGARVPMLPPGTGMPMPLGTAPLREGYVRGYHMTKPNRWAIGEGDEVTRSAAQNLRQIREHGLRLKNAQGHLYGEPDMNWFNSDVKGYDEDYSVEAHLPERWFGHGPVRKRPSDPYTIGGPNSNMAVGRDVSRRRFASFNEPWMRHYRYMQAAVDRGQRPGAVMRQYGSTLRSLRDRNEARRGQTPDMLPYEGETQGWDQFVAEQWRARHRGMGGYAKGGPVDFMPRALPPGVPENLRYDKKSWALMQEREAMYPILPQKKSSFLDRLLGRRAYGGEVTSLYGGDPAVMEEAAIKHFGVTDDVREAGYLTPSGKYLDFSGRHQSEGYHRQGDRWAVTPRRYGSSDPFTDSYYGKDYLAGQRSIDHNEASEFLPGVDHIDSVERMKSMGFIRVWGTTATGGGPVHTVGAEMTRVPTTAQVSRLVSAAREAEHASVDVYDPMGYRLPGASFRTEWPEDPMGGKRMGSFIRQAVEAIEKSQQASEQLRESMSLGAGFNPNMHRAGGGLAFHEGEFRRFSDMAAGNPLSRFGGNMWYQGRRRSMLEEANQRGWLDRTNFGTFRRSAERVLAVPGLASPGIADEMAVHWSRSIMDAVSQTGPAGRGQEDAFVRALQQTVPGLGVGYGYGNFAKAAAVASGNVWPPPFGRSPKVEPFYRAIRGQERNLVADSHHLMAGGFDPNGPASKVNPIKKAGVMIGTRPTAERAMMLEASANVQGEYSSIWPSMRRWQAGIWGEHFPFGGKPQPIQNAYTNLIVPKGMRGDLPPGSSMTPSGLFIPPPKATGGPVVAKGHLAKQIFSTAADWASDPFMAMMAWQAQQAKKKMADGGPVSEGVFEGLMPARLISRFGSRYGDAPRLRPTKSMLSAIAQIRGADLEHNLMFDPAERMSLLAHATGDATSVEPEGYRHGVPLWATDRQAQRFGLGRGDPEYRFNKDVNKMVAYSTNALDMEGLVGVHNHPAHQQMGAEVWRPSTGDIGSMLQSGNAESWVVTPHHTTIMRNPHGFMQASPYNHLLSLLDTQHEAMGLPDPQNLVGEEDFRNFIMSRRLNLDPKVWNYVWQNMADKYNIEFEHYSHPRQYHGTQMKLPGMQRGGPALGEIRTLQAYKRYVAQHADEPLFTRWSPDITKDMVAGARSRHLEYPYHGDIEKGISAMPASPGAARLLEQIDPDNPDRADYNEMRSWRGGLSGSYDLGPVRNLNRWSYREDPLEGYRKRNLYLMRGRPVGRGFDEEPVLDPESIEPIAKIRRNAVETAYRQWYKEQFGRDVLHRALGGRARNRPLHEWTSKERHQFPSDNTSGTMHADWYRERYSLFRNEDYVGRPRLNRDFTGAGMSVAGRIGRDWDEVMSGKYQTGPYARYMTDQQWIGPEAGQPRVAIPGMQDEPELGKVLQSIALSRFQGRGIKPHAAGGPAGGGLYIINEEGDGSEGFVANRDAHHIPKFVMDRIPHARDGARTGMINKPANSLFAPQQDGVIIPKWAVPYVPILHAATGLSNVHGVAVDPTDPRIPTINSFASGPGMTPDALATHFGLRTWADHIGEMTRGVERSGPSRGRDIPTPSRPDLSRELAEGRAGIGKELPSRTAQGAVASVASFLFGGVQQLGQAQVRRVQAEQDWAKSMRVTTNQLQTYKGTLGGFREAIAAVGKTTDEGIALDQARTNYIARAKPKLQEAIALEKERAQALEEADAKARPTSAGIVKNIGVIIGATSLYGMAMQAASAVIQPAVDGSVEAIKSLADQVTGFGSTSTRVSKGLGDTLNQTGGNLTKTFADVGLQTRMSAGFSTFLEQTLGGAVVAKAAGANQGQQSELFRAALGVGNAPTGLTGGYGGVFGTSLLASQLGGGKGVMEQISGDISAFSAGKQGGFAGAQATGFDFDKGLLFAQNQNFRDYVTGQAKEQGNPLGAISDLVGGAGDVLRDVPVTTPGLGALGAAAGFFFPKTQTPTQNDTGGFVNPALLGKSTPEQKGIEAYLANLTEEANRGAKALGTSTANTYKLATSQEQLIKGTEAAAASGDAFAVSMAVNGVILTNAVGEVATGVEAFDTAAKNIAKGLTLPDPAAFAKTVAQSLTAGFQQAALISAHEIATAIPGALGMELAANPFIPAAAGILPPGGGGFTGTIGGINVGDTLAKTQQAQNDLTQQGADALKELSAWIGNQPGMTGPDIEGVPMPGGGEFESPQAAFDSFTGDMMNAGKAIAGWQERIAGAQASVQWAQYSNNLRLANRAFADARALAGQGGGGRGSRGELGGIERQQTLLGFGLQQKTINFQTAIAGFQAPGLTSEERAARQEQAKLEAAVAQKQLNLSERGFQVGAERGVTDTSASRKLLKQEYQTQTAVAAAQRAIATEQMKLSQAQQKAQSVLNRAQGNFQSSVGAATQFVAQFGGAVKTVTRDIYEAAGYNVGYDRKGKLILTGGPATQPSGDHDSPALHANGFLGSFARGAMLQVGEAGPETVAILRNPRAMMMGGGGGFGGGGGGPVTVTLNLTVQGDVSGDATIAKIVRAVEDSFNRKAARLGMRSYVSASG